MLKTLYLLDNTTVCEVLCETVFGVRETVYCDSNIVKFSSELLPIFRQRYIKESICNLMSRSIEIFDSLTRLRVFTAGFPSTGVGPKSI